MSGSARLRGVGVTLALLLAAFSVRAQNLTILHSFDGADGASPMDGLTRDAVGNFYGSTSAGGVTGSCAASEGGTIFKMDPAGTVTTLHAFTGNGDGCFPWANVLRDSEGNLYGSTITSTVFEIDPAGNFSTLHTFTGIPDGDFPAGNLVRDADGNLYGVTSVGGEMNLGVVFRIDVSGEETILHSFAGGADGNSPSTLFLDKAGNLYGTTVFGGNTICSGSSGCGTIFKIDAHGNESILYSFTGEADGAHPLGGVVRNDQGNLYGTTSAGGLHACTQLGCGNCFERGCGTVFKLDAAGALTVLHTFQGGSDGSAPMASLIRDANGNFYGTTPYAGDAKCHCGTVFKIDAAGNESVVVRFNRARNGAFPYGNLMLDSAGKLYGTTDLGGVWNHGIIFELTPPF